MTNNATGLVALIGAITALVTALATLLGIILHTRSHNGQSSSAAQQSPPASEIHPSAENTPYHPQS